MTAIIERGSISIYLSDWKMYYQGTGKTISETINKVGFNIERTQTNNYEFISDNASNAGKKYGIKSISIVAFK